jgi:hypothetical protein
VGVAAFGAIVNGTLGATTLEGGRVPAGLLTTAVHHVFVATAALAVLMLAAVLLMPRDRGAASAQATPSAPEVAAQR